MNPLFALLGLCQDNRPIENYVKDFLDLSYQMAATMPVFKMTATMPVSAPKMAVMLPAPVFKMATTLLSPVTQRAIATTTPALKKAVVTPAPAIKMASHEHSELFVLPKMANHEHYELSVWLYMNIIELFVYSDNLCFDNLSVPAFLSAIYVYRSRAPPAPPWCPMSLELWSAEALPSIFFLGGEVPGRMEEAEDTQVHNCPMTQVHDCPMTQVHDSPMTQVHVWPMTQVHVCPMTQVHVCPMTQVHVCPMTQVHVCHTTQDRLCPLDLPCHKVLTCPPTMGSV
ncbi:uncharacterized protein [Misgurnus anguillicaudatus]|uniref:uncharacterized protein n=1 Tax=Misgurnus anguillicaudatus TaxID=75329 RepID=UPI003CCF2482